MKISYNWLQEFIELDLTPEEVADKLTLVGLEVEEWTHTGSLLEGVVVGSVIDVRPHPNADRLRICDVDLGVKTVQIVCGAPNVAAGQYVPVATVGSTLPPADPKGESLTIRKAKLRGESSSGMICSRAELGLGNEHDGIWELEGTPEVGAPLRDVLDLRTDTIFDIALTPNRPDAACHLGVARDLAALVHQPLKRPDIPTLNLDGDLQSQVPVRIENPDRCGRYVAMVLDDVSVGPSPSWLRQRLESLGLRPINNVVDATNMILHEMGQPLHAFDLEKIRGGEVVVQTLNKETRFTTLDHQERTLPKGTLAICDSDGPMAIAGIMGGLESEVSESTTRILLESAWFEPTGIRRTSKELTLQTDASYRYERGVDPELARRAAQRAARLIADLTGGTIRPAMCDLYPTPAVPRTVQLRPRQITRILGVDLDLKTVRRILHALEIDTTEKDGTLHCSIPTFRPDLEREIDLVEEVGRIYDYNRIPAPAMTPRHSPAPLHPWERLHQAVREAARRLAYQEITTNSLHSKEVENLFSEPSEQIDTLNPVSRVATTLRTTLISGFLNVCQYNTNRKARSLKLFEVGHTYRRGVESEWIPGIQEESHLLLGLYGLKHEESWRNEETAWSAFDLKADLESLFLQIGIDPVEDLETRTEGDDHLLYLFGETEIARLSRLKGDILEAFDLDRPATVAQLRLSKMFHSGLYRDQKPFTSISRFPGIEYDAAYIVSSQVPVSDMETIIRNVSGEPLHALRVFDIYEGEELGESKKSIAFRFSFLDSNKTLTIKDVEPIVKEFTKKLDQRLGATLRS
ncbi:MAG: phenylalanine--tRNA ligase subunit beta [Balneolaceae bacterium]